MYGIVGLIIVVLGISLLVWRGYAIYKRRELESQAREEERESRRRREMRNE